MDVHAQDPKHNGAKLCRVTKRPIKMGDSVVSRDHLKMLPEDLKISPQFISNSDPQNKDLMCKVISSNSMAAMSKALAGGTLKDTGEATVTIYRVVRWYNLGIYHGTSMERIAYFAQAQGTLYVTLIARPRPNALLSVTPIFYPGVHIVRFARCQRHTQLMTTSFHCNVSELPCSAFME